MKSTYIWGAAVLGVVLVLAVLLALVGLGVIDSAPNKLVISTGSAEAMYAGEALTCDEWELASGELQKGHSLRVDVVGSQLFVGESENLAVVTVLDENGADVTDSYEIEYMLGTLRVLGTPITVQTGGATKAYDGTPLFCAEVSMVLGELLPGHTITLLAVGSQIEVGKSNNTFAISIVDEEGNNVLGQYTVTPIYGELIVTEAEGGGGGNTDDEGGEGEGEGEGGDGLGGGLSGGQIGGGGGDSGGEGEPVVVLKIKTDTLGKHYLRAYSFGVYQGQSWSNQVPVYNVLLDGTYSMQYLPGLVLQGSDFEAVEMRIENLTTDYVLPYYLSTDMAEYDIQANDAQNSGDTEKIYTVKYYFYDYLGNKNEIASIPATYAEAEAAYAAFVRNEQGGNYLAIDSATADYMRALAAREGISADDADVIAKVAAYIQGAATYNLKYDSALDAEENIAIAFLETYKEGKCDHYATAATLLFRALGIPARFTVGYVVDVESAEWTEVTSLQAHAWVEVYIDGMGWVYVEVTGSVGGEDSGGEEPGGEEPGGGEPGGDGLPTLELEIYPGNIEKLYDGTPLDAATADVKLLSKDDQLKVLLDAGYTYTVRFEGARTEVGYGEIVIADFVLIPPEGEEAPYIVNVTKGTGRIHVYETVIVLQSSSTSKIYDGSPFGENADIFVTLKEGSLLAASHRVTAVFAAAGTMFGVGEADNTFAALIFDGDTDVTYRYKIIRRFGTLTVEHRELVLEADSIHVALDSWDGNPILLDAYTMSGTLVAGDEITVTVEGELAEPGQCTNQITAVLIKNAAGEDVTANYAVVCKEGNITLY